MADSYLSFQNPTSTDKKMDTEQLTVGSNIVQRERVQIAGTGADEIAPVSATDGLTVNLGSNNDVTVASLPLPTGAATSAKQDTIIGHVDGVETLLGTIDADTSALAGAVSGTKVQVDVVGALPAGTNLLGKVSLQASIGNGCEVFKSLDIDESEEDVKTSAGDVYGYYYHNNATSTRYLKFYNDTAANVVVGTTVPVATLPLPAGAAANIGFSIPISFTSAICVAATTGAADNNTGAPATNDVVINVFFK
jgi:hypothetical protein